MKRRTIIYIVIVMLLTEAVHAQLIQVKGKPVDSTGQVLEGATVKLYRDSVAIRQERAGMNGFIFNRITKGRYELKVSFVGYKDLKLIVLISGKDSMVNLGQLVLKQGSDSSLLEVVVKTTIPPVFMRKDTLVYNASAYKVRPYETVEDLLKKLPGVSVDRNGKITLNGKPVEKIYVDGKEFLSDDPKSITQGFNADMVATVEAFDNTSTDKRFMGLQDANANKAINVKLKKQYRNSLNGNIRSEVSQDPKQNKGQLDATKLAAESLTSTTISYNSIKDIYNGPATVFWGGGAGSAADTRHSEARLNYTLGTLGNKKIVSGYSMKDDLKIQEFMSDRETFLPDSSLIQHSESSVRNYSQEHVVEFTNNLRLDSMQSMEIKGQGNYRYIEDANSNVQSVSSKGPTFYHSLSDAVSYNTSGGSSYKGAMDITLRSKFRQRSRFMVLRFIGSVGGDQRNSRIQNTLVSSGATQTLNQISTESSPDYSVGVSATYTQPITKGKIIDFNYGINYRRNENNRQSLNYNAATGKYDLLDTTTTNQIIATRTIQRFALGYNVNGAKLRYQVGIGVNDSRGDNDVTHGGQQSFSQHVLNWFPRASFEWGFLKGRNFKLKYDGSSQSPTIQQLQPLPDLRNPLLVRTGNPDLSPQFDHTVSLSFNRIQVPKSMSISGSSGMSRSSLRGSGFILTLHLTERKIVPSIVNLPGGIQQVRFENINGSFNVLMSANKQINFGEYNSIALSGLIVYSKDPSFINGAVSMQSKLGVKPNIVISYSPMERMTLEADAQVEVSKIDYSIGQASYTQIRQIHDLSFRYELAGGWALNSEFFYQQQISGTSLPVLDNKLLNAFISKRMFKNKSGLIKFSAFDILGTAKGISQNFSEQSISSYSSKSPERLFLFSFIWKFVRSGSGKK